MRRKEMKVVNFFTDDGAFYGCAISGPVANRYEKELQGKYGETNVKRVETVSSWITNDVIDK